MTSCAIMQPTYLPWAGYFCLLQAVDRFVILDDVQYERDSWQCKNRILLGGRAVTVQVPVIKQSLQELIVNIVIDNSKDWRGRHIRQLRDAYGALEGGRAVVELIEEVFASGHDRLVDLTTTLIARLADQMGIATPIDRASTLKCGGRRSEHVADICRAVGADVYFSPTGAREYLTKDRFEETSGLTVNYLAFPAPAYPQGGGAFVSHLSIVDVLAHCGPEYAKTYKSGGL